MVTRLVQASVTKTVGAYSCACPSESVSVEDGKPHCGIVTAWHTIVNHAAKNDPDKLPRGGAVCHMWRAGCSH